MSSSSIERFLSRVDTTASRDVCWLWQGTIDSKGYGVMWMEGRQHKAHRLSVRLLTGQSLPDNLVVCHRCDNPCCVNPAHLFVGTKGDNNRDRALKGRSARNYGDKNGARTRPDRLARGERNGSRLHPERVARGEALSRSLTEAQAREILVATGLQREIAERFGINRSQVSMIKNGKSWKHLRASCEK